MLDKRKRLRMALDVVCELFAIRYLFRLILHHSPKFLVKFRPRESIIFTA